MPIVKQAAERRPPGPGQTPISVPSGSSSAAVDFSAFEGQLVTIKLEPETQLVHGRFGTSAVGAATTNDLPIRDGEEFYIPRDGSRSFGRFYGNGAVATIYWAGTSG